MASSNNLDVLFADGELPFGPGNGHLFIEQNALYGSQAELPAILDFQARWPWPSAPGRSGRLCRGRRSGTGEVEVYDRKKLAYANCAVKVIVDGRKEFANLN